MMRHGTLKLLLCCVVLVVVAGCSGNSEAPEPLVVGNSAPNFTLTSMDGTVVNSNTLKGQVVVLNFWATWCLPCMSEIPELKEFAANSRAKVLGIALDKEGRAAVEPFVAQHKINYTVLLGDEETFERFNGLGIPYTLVLDQSQRVVKIYRGPTTRESLEADLKGIDSGTLVSGTR
jgi:thiol-disulfide isomerase/thioredoxin